MIVIFTKEISDAPIVVPDVIKMVMPLTITATVLSGPRKGK